MSSCRATNANGWELRLGDWREVLADVVGVNALIVDPPYDERTHDAADYAGRKVMPYTHFAPDDYDRLIHAWSNRCTGWFVVITCHTLAPVADSAMSRAGRYVFAPLPFVSRGSRVRLAGDGPSNWTTWIVVGRPRGGPCAKWGTLPGAYIFPPETMPIVGGKPLSLMRALVRDYTRPGDLVCDPCAGAGTTLLAAVMEGRRAIGAEIDPKTFELARQRLSGLGPSTDEQPNLFYGGEK